MVVRHRKAPREGGDEYLQGGADQLAGVELISFEEEQVDLKDERGQNFIHLEKGRKERGGEGEREEGRNYEMLLLCIKMGEKDEGREVGR